MSLRCHFDADGWLQGPVNITHLTALTPNRYNSGFANQARGLVQHTEDGFEAGTVETFMNPASQASAFFSVSEQGACHQYLPVGHGYVAWGQGAGNEAWRSCECEDKTRTGDPMTPPQMTAFAQILEACSTYDGFPLQVTDDVNGHGLITHGDGGAAWGNHPDCPGPARKAQRGQIVALAMSIRQEKHETPPPAVRKWTTAGMGSLTALAAQEHTTPAVILALTAEHSAPGGVFPVELAAYLNSVFGGAVDPARPMPRDLVLYLPG
jgi:hypothetical protein